MSMPFTPAIVAAELGSNHPRSSEDRLFEGFARYKNVSSSERYKVVRDFFVDEPVNNLINHYLAKVNRTIELMSKMNSDESTEFRLLVKAIGLQIQHERWQRVLLAESMFDQRMDAIMTRRFFSIAKFGPVRMLLRDHDYLPTRHSEVFLDENYGGLLRSTLAGDKSESITQMLNDYQKNKDADSHLVTSEIVVRRVMLQELEEERDAVTLGLQLNSNSLTTGN